MIIQSELKQAYLDLDIDSVILNNNMVSFYEYASFNFTKENGDTVLCRLHIGDVVSIKLEEGENFAMIKAIFSHKQEYYNLQFAFIIVDWFEDMSQQMLGCPIFKLRKTSTWRKLFSINLVDSINSVHFVHYCKGDECTGSDHDSRNALYMRNAYFFKAV